MSSEPEQTAPPAAPPGGQGPLVVAAIVGVVLGGFAGILLAFLADLPAYLGMFFFLLVGLLIGAFCYRFGKSAAPAPKGTLWVIGLLVVFTTWGSSLYVGYRLVASTAVDAVLKSTRERLTSEQKAELADRVPVEIDNYLRTNYPPGGFLGYMRWAASSDGVLKVPREPVGIGNQPVSIRYAGWQWLLRSIVSLMLLMFSILSQVLSLSLPPQPRRGWTASRRDRLA